MVYKICLCVVLALIAYGCQIGNQADPTSSVRTKTIELIHEPKVVSDSPAGITNTRLAFNSHGDALLAWLVVDNAYKNKLVSRFYDSENEEWSDEQFLELPTETQTFQLVSNEENFALMPDDWQFVAVYSWQNLNWSIVGPFSQFNTHRADGSSSSVSMGVGLRKSTWRDAVT